MPHHVSITLPDGRTATADYRNPIVKPMRKVNEWLQARGSRDADPPPPVAAAYAAVEAWLDENAEQSQRCRAGLLPGGACEHD